MAKRSWESEFAEYFAARVVPMRRLAYALCGDWHTAEDLVQAAFVRLYRNWKRVRGGTVDAYTRQILVNVYLSDRRNRGRELVMLDPPDAPEPGEDGSNASDVRLDIARLLAMLPPMQRAAVVLRHLEDLPVSEVAELLGVAEGTVKSQTSRAVRALRATLGVPLRATEDQA
ncbi:MAG: SigE family RNA polymerase sigma factor [Dactylosporangium sp.]|nr:SigE family RNA polymerase sigma factor [Dactylosporangium sp.]NNJ61746.1 SigE family RNA polymerase sigma factor [Dactylosporangium sp.]